MRAFPAGAGQQAGILILVGLMGIWAFDAPAAQPDKPGKKGESSTAQPRTSDTPPKVEKTYAFEMRDKPWKQVMEWLADTTGLAFIGPEMPQGTFNFIDPKKKQYTIPEIIDLINEGLQTNTEKQKYTLLRRDRSFTLVPADKPIEEALVPRITLDELDSRGNSEVVSLVYPATGLVAEDIGPAIENKLMSQFGKVLVIAEASQLILRDTVGSLRRIVKTLKEIAEQGGSNSSNYAHQCKYVKARDAERLLKDLLGDPAKLLQAIQQQANQGQFGGRGRFGGGGFQMGGMGGDFGGLQQAQAQAPAPAQPAQKIRMHYISSDDASNTVYVTGPANIIAQAKDLVETKYDVKRPGRGQIVPG